MTNRLENEAAVWRDKGFQEIAMIIDHARIEAQQQGAPKVFEENEETTPTVENILSALLPENDENKPTVGDFAEHFRSALGGRLPNETVLRNLRVIKSDRKVAQVLNHRLSKLKTKAMKRYNQWVGSASKKFMSVGDLRAAGANDISSLRNVGAYGTYFLINAFKPLERE